MSRTAIGQSRSRNATVVSDCSDCWVPLLGRDVHHSSARRYWHPIGWHNTDNCGHRWRPRKANPKSQPRRFAPVGQFVRHPSWRWCPSAWSALAPGWSSSLTGFFSERTCNASSPNSRGSPRRRIIAVVQTAKQASPARRWCQYRLRRRR